MRFSPKLLRVVLFGGAILFLVLGVISYVPSTPATEAPSLSIHVGEAQAAPLLQDVQPITGTTTATPQGNRAILLNPFSGPSNTPITAMGQNWQPDQRIIINLIEEESETPYAVASSIVSEDGSFTVSFFIPIALADQAQVVVVAEALDGTASARAFYTISDVINQQPTAEPGPVPGSSAEEPDEAEPDGVITAGRLNVREGPGTLYPTLGQVVQGQEVEISGQNAGWWRIEYLHSFGDYGWVSGDFVRINNVGDVPFIAVAPPPQPTATPIPTPTPMPQMVCNPGQWSGCSPSFCPVEYVSQCTADGQWGQCVWDPGSCSVYDNPTGGGDDDDDDDSDEDDDNDDEDDSSDEDDDGDDNDDGDDDDS